MERIGRTKQHNEKPVYAARTLICYIFLLFDQASQGLRGVGLAPRHLLGMEQGKGKSLVNI